MSTAPTVCNFNTRNALKSIKPIQPPPTIPKIVYVLKLISSAYSRLLTIAGIACGTTDVAIS